MLKKEGEIKISFIFVINIRFQEFIFFIYSLFRIEGKQTTYY